MKKLLFFPMSALLILVFLSCEKDKIEPFAFTDDNIELQTRTNEQLKAQPKNCFILKSSFEGCLNYQVTIEVIGEEPVTGFGASPTPGNVGGYPGYWTSVVTKITPSGKGATHYNLRHKFFDDAGDYFYTNDRAVCAPAKGSGATCMINDQMTIERGIGKFASIRGKIKTHGLLTLGNFAECSNDLDAGRLSLDLRGNVCMD